MNLKMESFHHELEQGEQLKQENEFQRRKILELNSMVNKIT